MRRLTELLGTPPAADTIDTLVEDGELERDGDWIYRRETAALERELADRVAGLVRRPPQDRGKRLGRKARRPGTEDERERPLVALTEQQHGAVQATLEHRLSLITGGPGTGKTATIKAIVTTAADQGLRVLLVAPTGRAAARMREASGIQAATVHSALGWIPGEGPTHDAEDPLRCDLLVVDETSMANLELLVTLLRAVPDQAHVVLVGDADQLAPVGAGKPFAELVAGGHVPTTRLDHIFRHMRCLVWKSLQP